jgi:hypothetical protein
LTDTGDSVKGAEFVRRIRRLGRKRGIHVEWRAERGNFGDRLTTVRNLKDELDKGAFHGMLKQLGLEGKDLE